MAPLTEALNFKFHFISVHLHVHLNSCMGLVAASLLSTGGDHELSKGRGFVHFVP